MAALPQQGLESIHPALWRGSQLARAHGIYVDTGYAALSVELPGGGWPLGTLVELLVQQAGVGEVRLLQPALAAVSKRPIALLQPPKTPNALAFAYMGLPLEKLVLVRATRTADALWSAEQMLKAGSCGAVVLWQQYVRSESVRRLHLAAQSSDTLFLKVRPLASAPPRLIIRYAATRRVTSRRRDSGEHREAEGPDARGNNICRATTVTSVAEPLWR